MKSGNALKRLCLQNVREIFSCVKCMWRQVTAIHFGESRMKMCIFLLCLIVLAQPAHALEKLFSRHCASAGVPKDLAMAVARQESGLRPLCVNVAGKDYWPESRAEAAEIIRKAQKENRSFDVGLMQINSQWISRWGMDPVSLLDPEVNIRCGLRILREEIGRHGLNWRAVGSYHSPNPERGRRYAWMVYGRLKGKAELRSMLANGRLRGRFMPRSARLKNFRPVHSSEAGLLGQPHSQRKPVGME